MDELASGKETRPARNERNWEKYLHESVADTQASNGPPASSSASAEPQSATGFPSLPSSASTASQRCQPTTVLYHRRFYLLLLFALNGFTQGAIWNTWGPLTQSANIAFGWDDATIALMSNWGPIAYIVSMPLFSWLMDVRGLRWATLLTITLVTVGAGLRCITCDTPAVTWLTHTGQFLNGLGGTVAMGGPPVMSSVWFPVHQRTTATGFSAALNALGVAVAFILEAEITTGIMHLMYIEFGFSALLFLLILIYFPSRPPTPPSLTAAVKRVEFKSALKRLLFHKKFWMMGMPYALSGGIYGGWSSVFAMNVQVISVSEELAGWLGFWATVAGQVAAVIISIFADVFSRRMKLFLLIIYTIASLMFLVLALLCSNIIQYNAIILWTTMIVGSMCIYGAIPLFFELVCESTYPIAEGITNGLLTWLNNVTGLLFLFVVMIPIGTTWMNWCLFGAALVCTPVFVLYKERYGRLDTDQLAADGSLIKDIPDSLLDEENPTDLRGNVETVSDAEPLIQ